MKTTDELKEMELGDLMDHLIEAEDTVTTVTQEEI